MRLVLLSNLVHDGVEHVPYRFRKQFVEQQQSKTSLLDDKHCAYGNKCIVGTKGGQHICFEKNCLKPVHLPCFHKFGGACSGKCVCEDVSMLRCFNHSLAGQSIKPALSTPLQSPAITLLDVHTPPPPKFPSTVPSFDKDDPQVKNEDQPRRGG